MQLVAVFGKMEGVGGGGVIITVMCIKQDVCEGLSAVILSGEKMSYGLITGGSKYARRGHLFLCTCKRLNYSFGELCREKFLHTPNINVPYT